MATVRHTIPEENPGALPAPQGESAGVMRAPDTRQASPSAIDPRSVPERFEALLRRVQANRPSEDVALIRKAWEFCVKHHEGQMRASGEPYIIHPLEVAEVLAELKMDATSIA